MGKNFLEIYNFKIVDSSKILNKYPDSVRDSLCEINEIKVFLDEFKGRDYLNGVFKIHHPNSAFHWTNKLKNLFVDFESSFYCFAFDWLGRQFAFSTNNNKSLILMFDSGVMQVYKMEGDLNSFFNTDLVDYLEETLSTDVYFDWLKKNPAPSFFECVGLKIPLFLNGKDSIQNYHMLDIQAYWDFNEQVYNRIKDLPDGAKVNSLKFLDP